MRLADYALPGTPVRVSVSDRGSTAAVTVAEPDGEALFLISEQGVRRLLHAVRLPAMAFLPGSADFVIADDTGAIYRIGGDLQLIQITTAPGAKALAGTADGSRLLVVTEHRIDSIRFDTGDTRSIGCSCTAVAATPLKDSTFLLTNPNDGPMWVVDASQTELRVAFIPEVVNE